MLSVFFRISAYVGVVTARNIDDAAHRPDSHAPYIVAQSVYIAVAREVQCPLNHIKGAVPRGIRKIFYPFAVQIDRNFYVVI